MFTILLHSEFQTLISLNFQKPSMVVFIVCIHLIILQRRPIMKKFCITYFVWFLATLEHPFCHSTNNGFVKVTHSNVTHSNVTHGNERFHKCCNNQVCETITRGVTWILHIIYSIFFYASCCCCYWMCESDDWGGRWIAICVICVVDFTFIRHMCIMYFLKFI